jgi:AbrB family looped-hinge helix DNA binding protein
METTLSSKGQIVIPLKIRQRHGWKSGVCFSIIDEGDALVLKPSVNRKTTTLEEVIGCAGYLGPKKSLSDMNAGILAEARKRAASWSR